MAIRLKVTQRTTVPSPKITTIFKTEREVDEPSLEEDEEDMSQHMKPTP